LRQALGREEEKSSWGWESLQHYKAKVFYGLGTASTMISIVSTVTKAWSGTCVPNWTGPPESDMLDCCGFQMYLGENLRSLPYRPIVLIIDSYWMEAR